MQLGRWLTRAGAGVAISAAPLASAQFAGFSPPTFFPAGNRPTDAVVADFDGDGDVDIAVTLQNIGAPGLVALLLNDGAGSFSAPSLFTVGAAPQALVARDVDSDSDIDLLVVNTAGNSVTFLRNNGSASFSAISTMSVSSAPHDIAVEDFNNDGKLDFATANGGSNTVSLYFGNGLGSFSAGGSVSTQDLGNTKGVNPHAIMARDVDNDGDIDLMTANAVSNDTTLLEGNGGTGNFFSRDFALFTNVGIDPISLAAGDFDKDGDFDVVVPTRNDSHLSYLRHPGFSPFTGYANIGFLIINSGAVGVAVADFDLDGNPDILTADEIDDTLSLRRSNGSGAFFALETFADGVNTSPSTVVAADVDGDGDMDAVVPNLLSNNVAVFYNLTNAAGASPPVASIDQPSPASCVAFTTTVTGVADAPGGGFDFYKLENKPISSSTWTLIAQSSTPVPAPGGTLANWDTTTQPEGYHQLRLTVRNTAGVEAQDTHVVWLSRNFNIVNYFVTNGKAPAGPATVAGGNVCLFGTVNDDGCGPNQYIAQSAPSGSGAWTDVDPSTPVYSGDRFNEVLATWDTIGLGAPDGLYDMDVFAWNGAGQSAEQISRITIDNTPPVAVIDNPPPCTEVRPGEIVKIVGTANDANMGHWVVQYSDPVAGQWVTIGSGVTNVVNDVLATWNTAQLPHCCYALRVVVWDRSVINCTVNTHRSEYVRTIAVRCPGDITGDGKVGPSDLLFLLSAWGMVCP